jgi:hypothetical protein
MARFRPQDATASAAAPSAAASAAAPSAARPASSTRRALAVALPAAALLVATPRLRAQPAGWPNKPIRMIVGYTPGGFTDNMARTVGEPLGRALGQPVVFDYKPGANSMIGTEMLVKSAPDGYTLTTVIAAHSANPSLYPKMAFDAQADVVPIALTGAHKRDPGFSEKEMKVIEKRAADGGLCALGLRFSGDPMAPAERFTTLKDRLGDNFEAIELDSSPGNSGGFGRMAHSVLTLEVRDREGQQAYEARKRMMEFLKERLT